MPTYDDTKIEGAIAQIGYLTNGLAELRRLHEENNAHAERLAGLIADLVRQNHELRSQIVNICEGLGMNE